MSEHYWRQYGFTIAGYVEGSPFLTPVQTYKCERCNDVISLPDCYHANGRKNNTCVTLMSLGCEGGAVRPPLPPRKEKPPYEDKKDYPAKKRK